MTIFSTGINGKASTDAGAEIFSLTSTEEERKKLLRMVYTDLANNGVLLDVTMERDTIVDALPIEDVADAMPERIVNIDVEIPVGQTVLGILKPQSAGNQGTIDGFIEYEIL